MPDCIFCRIVSEEIPAVIVYSDDEVVAFRDVKPQAPHHIQIIPRRHIPTVDDLNDDDANLMGRMVLVAAGLAEHLGFDEEGYRLVINCRSMGGQEVHHLHLHLLGGRQMNWPPG